MTVCCESEPRRMTAKGQCGCGCGPSFRRFYSSKEERERLESYRDDLANELEGVQERIGKLEVE